MPTADDFVQIAIPELSGQSGKVRLRLFNTPFLHSASRNSMKFVEMKEDDFYIFVLAEIEENIEAKQKTKFLFKKTIHCRQCQAELEAQQEQEHTFKFEIGNAEVPAFGVELDIPAVRCSACGTYNAMNAAEIDNIIEAQSELFMSVPNL